MLKLLLITLLLGVAVLSAKTCLRQNKITSVAGREPQLDSSVIAGFHIDPTAYFDAALKAENGDESAMEQIIFDVGAQLNDMISGTLQLSAEAKEEMDDLLKQNYVEIADDAREEYLRNIDLIETDTFNYITSKRFSTQAELLSAAINTSVCGFSSLVFIPLGIDLSLKSSLVASHLLQSPCENILQPVADKIGQSLYQTGLFMDIEQTRVNLQAHKQSVLAELSTSQLELNVDCEKIINRSFTIGGNSLLNWEAARVNIIYSARVRYGYDLAEDFNITVNNTDHNIVITLPQLQLLDVSLEPLSTVIDDGGIVDLTSEHFEELYQTAREKAIIKAKERGVAENAAAALTNILKVLFSPFINAKNYPYTIEFRDSVHS